jgi:hypothetical protein
VTEEEVKIDLDEFKRKYVGEKGYPRCDSLAHQYLLFV